MTEQDHKEETYPYCVTPEPTEREKQIYTISFAVTLLILVITILLAMKKGVG